MPEASDDELHEVLADLAPGTVVRDGIDRIISAGRGALIVLEDTEPTRGVVSGGFNIDSNLTAQRIAELAKMDGAVIIDTESERIVRANVHLVPDATIPTHETGTRHRSAERVARQTGAAVLSVSESMSRVTLYLGDVKHVLEDVSSLLFRANQALSTLERYRTRLDEVTSRLGQRELDGDVTLRDVCTTLQRGEMVRRIEAEVIDHVDELGREGRLIELQRAELMSDVDEERTLLVEDYRGDRRRKLETVLRDLDSLTSHTLLELENIAEALDHEPDKALDTSLRPRGYRLLSRIPRLPASIIDKLVARFGSLSNVLHASVEELLEVDGVGEARATSIQEGLRQLAATTTRDG